MELKEMIKVMQHYEDGGDIECSLKGQDSWGTFPSYCWDWGNVDYRIKEPKQKVTIEKWLLKDAQGNLFIRESLSENFSPYNKIKLLESYEVEL